MVRRNRLKLTYRLTSDAFEQAGGFDNNNTAAQTRSLERKRSGSLVGQGTHAMRRAVRWQYLLVRYGILDTDREQGSGGTQQGANRVERTCGMLHFN